MKEYLLFLPDQYGKKYLNQPISEAPILITDKASARQMMTLGLALIKTEAELAAMTEAKPAAAEEPAETSKKKAKN